MANKSTKKALLLSVLAMLLCVAMLVGTTFAWFTDSVTSGRNTIKAGNLDVVLNYWDKTANKFAEVNKDTKLFDDAALWEPGHTEIAYLEVSNAGTLALKYQLSVNVVSEVKGTNVANEEFKLSDYLVFKAVELKETEIGTLTREQAIEKAGTVKGLADYTGDVEYLEKTGDKDYVALIIYMPTTVGNEANYKTGTVAPSIIMGVDLVATQMVSEKDFFGNDYDDLADFIPAWDGEAADEVPAEDNGVITINTAAELAAFAESVNAGTSYAGKTVALGASINLGNKAWTPIGACDTKSYFQGTFDGQGNTVYGLNVDNSTDPYMYSTAGFFGWIDAGAATIKNVNFDGATVKGSHWVGVVAGYMTGSIENCNVTNSTVVGNNVNDDANGDKIGGLVGFLNKGALKNNTVSDTSISGNRDIGGLVGSVTANQTVTENTVKNVTITYVTEKSYDSAGKIVSGRTGFVPDATNVAENVTIYKGNMVAPGVVEVGTKSYEVISKEGLLNVNDIIANTATGEGNGIKVKLLANIDLAGETWKPISTMWVDFDGNGKTISNLKTDAWKSGLFGYVGGGSIKNLTLENVNVTGAQAGAFAGSIEGKIENCVLKGENTITWAEKHQFNDPNAALESHSGIGAITGVSSYSTVNAEIAADATVTLDYGAIETQAAYIDTLTGYLTANNGTVVNNGKIIKKTSAVVNDQAAFNDAIDNGDNVAIELGSGSYEMPDGSYVNLKGKTITIKGDRSTIIDASNVDARDQFITGANVVFEGVTINFGKVNYMGFANTTNLTYKNCAINGLQFLFGDNVSFEGCELNSNGAEHCVWTYGVKNASFTDCTFTYGDRGINCYSDNDVAGGKQTVNFTNCKFVTANTASLGAVEINSYFFSVGIEVNLDGCTAPAYGQMAYVSPWDSTNGAKTTINIK